MSIEVKQLSKIYGTQLAVDAISFDLKKGEIVGFLGPNGAGKSTTMKMITGYIEPTAGSILVGGINVAENPIEIRKKLVICQNRTRFILTCMCASIYYLLHLYIK